MMMLNLGDTQDKFNWRILIPKKLCYIVFNNNAPVFATLSLKKAEKMKRIIADDYDISKSGADRYFHIKEVKFEED